MQHYCPLLLVRASKNYNVPGRRNEWTFYFHCQECILMFMFFHLSKTRGAGLGLAWSGLYTINKYVPHIHDCVHVGALIQQP